MDNLIIINDKPMKIINVLKYNYYKLINGDYKNFK